MKLNTGSVVWLSFISTSSAHYVFSRLIINNGWTKDFIYVRPLSPLTGNASDWYHTLKPNEDPTSLTFRCGPNATISGSQTKTADVTAGDTVGFGVGEPHFQYGNFKYDVPRLYHPGPASAWLSKAPDDDLDAYTGDGDWFKILSVITRTNQSIPITSAVLAPFQAQWGTYLATSWNFTIPATTPPGKYLLRFEHILAGLKNGTGYGHNEQYYANCAQLNIVNDGEVGDPSPKVKLPGIYAKNQPEFMFDIWDKTKNVSDFQMPGPAVWQG
ncbi:lytic polysaccharide monooxygenase [Lophiostoma macrostomum CBS 122681]|uniref:lytic cellulose monooxygenase (C4-dehydrogenating) n=1 Tax=Lophiostoma macrostomum CBS 122681 TaxID=1314788 RepID=A0A6A6SJH7_9PLEO|nr:lytic polysaccharide monooxygenase [Lophiostoma macrostomum CBS 122681]